jgi:glycosyltransferase EpsH
MIPDIPLVSIIIPVFNVEKYISQCIESTLNQTYKHLEIILVNDGSSDRSGYICSEYAKIDNRVHVFHQPNRGGCYAMQKGVDEASGKFMMFLDGDDWIEPTTIQVSLKEALTQEVDVVFWLRIREFADKSQRVRSLFEDRTLFKNESLLDLRRRLVGLLGEELKRPTETDALSSCWGKLFRIDVFRNNPNAIVAKDGTQNFDALINIIVFKDVKSALYIKEYFNHYRKYNIHSITKNHGFGLLEKYTAMFGLLESFLTSEKLFQNKSFATAFNNRVSLSIINITQSITSPAMSGNFFRKLDIIKKTLHHPTYKTSVNQLNLRFLKVHWIIFFLLCKIRFSLGVLLLGILMRKFR